MNLEDIARRAGVSRSTVSRVINNEPYVSAKTRQKVLAIIEEVGFTPNPAARMLVTQRTQVIGVVIPRTISVVFADTDYFPALLQGIADATHERNYATLLWLGHSDEEEGLFYQRILKNRLMDGLIIASATNEDAILRTFVENDVLFVMTERPVAHEERINYVSVNNVQAAEDAVNHLLALGRRRIGMIWGINNPDGEERLIGYRRALEKAGIPFDPTLLAGGNFNVQAGYIGMMQLLGQNIDALFASSDSMAFGALKAIKEANLRVPEDIPVVGFDDLPHATEATPPLTTIRQPIEQKGYQAACLLLDMIEGHTTTTEPQHIILPTELVLRGSTRMSTT